MTTWNKCDVDSTEEAVSFLLETLQCFKVLNPNTLHILCASTIDVAFLILVGAEWVIFPVFLY